MDVITRNAARMRRKLTWRGRKAMHSARVLDEVVDTEVRLVPALTGEAQRRAVDHLAELVLLSQAYRYYSYGWISRRELERRGKGALGRLESLSAPNVQQLTERE